jgi:hypothetical protein
MADLVLGPLLRYVSETEATVWVETEGPCEVEVLGHREPTFGFDDRHYALVRVEGLEPGGFYEYEVALDGECCWPLPGSEMPPSAIRTFSPGKPLDTLHVLAEQMARQERDEWPELLFLLAVCSTYRNRSTRRSAGSSGSALATLRLDGRHAVTRLDKTVAEDEQERSLEKTFERRIA